MKNPFSNEPDDPQEQAPQAIAFPPLRHFSISRYDQATDKHVQETIEAHYVQTLDQNGSVFAFFQYVLTPAGPQGEMKKMRSLVNTLDDVSIIDVPKSSLIMQ